MKAIDLTLKIKLSVARRLIIRFRAFLVNEYEGEITWGVEKEEEDINILK